MLCGDDLISSVLGALALPLPPWGRGRPCGPLTSPTHRGSLRIPPCFPCPHVPASPPREPFPRPHRTPAGSGAFSELSQPPTPSFPLISSLGWGWLPVFLHTQRLWTQKEPGRDLPSKRKLAKRPSRVSSHSLSLPQSATLCHALRASRRFLIGVSLNPAPENSKKKNNLVRHNDNIRSS